MIKEACVLLCNIPLKIMFTRITMEKMFLFIILKPKAGKMLYVIITM